MLVPLSVAPILLAQGSLIVYRHLIAYQWLIVLYLVAASTRLAVTAAARRAVTGALLMAVLVAGIYAHWNFDRNSARINAKELQFIQGALARARLPAHIVVIQPDVMYLGSFGRLPEPADEFGVTTTMYPQDIPWIVFGAAAQLGLPREHLSSVTGSVRGRKRPRANRRFRQGPAERSIEVERRNHRHATVRRSKFTVASSGRCFGPSQRSDLLTG